MTGSAKTRTTFSIDNHGPTVGTMSCGSGPFLFQGDVLRPGAPFATPQVAIANRPCIRIRGGFGAGTLQLAGYPVLAEVDALSYGADAPLSPVNPPGTVFFSTDEYAIGFPQGIVEPSLETEAPFGEIAASVFIDTGLPALPVSWVSGPFPNVQVVDGDGRPSASGCTLEAAEHFTREFRCWARGRAACFGAGPLGLGSGGVGWAAGWRRASRGPLSRGR